MATNMIIGGMDKDTRVYREYSRPDSCVRMVTQAKTITTGVGNVGVGEDDLMTWTIPAGYIANDGDVMNFKAFGTFGANANNKQVKAYIGGVLAYASGVQAQNNGTWAIDGMIVRTGSATQKVLVTFKTDSTLFTDEVKFTNHTADLTLGVIVKITGEGTANDDVYQEAFIFDYNNNA